MLSRPLERSLIAAANGSLRIKWQAPQLGHLQLYLPGLRVQPPFVAPGPRWSCVARETFLLVPKLSFGTTLPLKLCFLGVAAAHSSGTVVEAKLRRQCVPKKILPLIGMCPNIQKQIQMMKPLLSLPVFLTATALLWGQIPAISAQDAAQSVAEDALSFDKLPVKLKQIEDDFAKQVDVFVVVVDAELAAKRITDTVAQLLRTLARNARFNFGELNGSIPKNEALRAAVKELEAASKLYELRVNVLVTAVWENLRKRVEDAELNKLKSEEIATIIQTLQRIQGPLQRKNLSAGKRQFESQDFIAFLNAVKELADAERKQSLKTFYPAAMSFYNSGISIGLLSQADQKVVMPRLLEPMRKCILPQGSVIEAMIEARKPSQEVSTAISDYRRAMSLFDSFTGHEGNDPDRLAFSNVLGVYGAFVRALNSLENGKTEEADSHLKMAIVRDQSVAAQLLADRGNRGEFVVKPGNRAQIAAKLQNELRKTNAQRGAQTTADFAARMAAVKEPADLAAILAEIRKMSGERNEDISKLIRSLENLKMAWDRRIPGWIAIERPPYGEPSGALAKDYTALRNRVLRTLYAETLKAPELTAAPYADKGPEAAIEALCDDLAQRSEWKRLLDILQLRTPFAARRPDSQEAIAIAAIDSFLSGKNAELAEQWTDAAVAYKSVLRCTAPRAPIQPAADRLKAIAKAHPEAITEADKREKPQTNTSAQEPRPESPIGSNPASPAGLQRQ